MRSGWIPTLSGFVSPQRDCARRKGIALSLALALLATNGWNMAPTRTQRESRLNLMSRHLRQRTRYSKQSQCRMYGLLLRGGCTVDSGIGDLGKNLASIKEVLQGLEGRIKASTKTRKEAEGLTVGREKDPHGWYHQVVRKAGLIENYEVSGCYILRPAAMKIWKSIRGELEKCIARRLGAEETYFPLLVSEDTLQRESNHVEGFAPEVAWVTRSGTKTLDRPLAIRPTSETVIYPYFAKWIRSHRDLPLKVNQWCNIVRWEFSHPTPFIRSREFLWQEGHTAHATKAAAEAEVAEALDVYRLAVPVIPGKKTKREQFAGAMSTSTIETFIASSGRAIQAATAHCLGQNFAKIYGVEFENKTGGREYAWQNSWGLTTRAIGVVILTHGDDRGLVLPPNIAPIQVVVVPIPPRKTKNDPTTPTAEEILASAQRIKETIQQMNYRGSVVRVKLDDDLSRTPGWKYNYWELHGVPLRVEIGPRDVHNNTAVIVRRDSGKRSVVQLSDVESSIEDQLRDMQRDLLHRATETLHSRIRKTLNPTEFKKALEDRCVALVPWCGEDDAEEVIRKLSMSAPSVATTPTDQTEFPGETSTLLTGIAKSLCIPFDQPDMPPGTKCLGKPERLARKWVLFARSY